ncbi:MAG: hypothetical protein LC723_05305 [Actinobacteria bacterium]|nr:hypothetical protein [Actinomycetota bacterium]
MAYQLARTSLHITTTTGSYDSVFDAVRALIESMMIEAEGICIWALGPGFDDSQGWAEQHLNNLLAAIIELELGTQISVMAGSIKYAVQLIEVNA